MALRVRENREITSSHRTRPPQSKERNKLKSNAPLTIHPLPTTMSHSPVLISILPNDSGLIEEFGIPISLPNPLALDFCLRNVSYYRKREWCKDKNPRKSIRSPSGSPSSHSSLSWRSVIAASIASNLLKISLTSLWFHQRSLSQKFQSHSHLVSGIASNRELSNLMNIIFGPRVTKPKLFKSK